MTPRRPAHGIAAGLAALGLTLPLGLSACSDPATSVPDASAFDAAGATDAAETDAVPSTCALPSALGDLGLLDGSVRLAGNNGGLVASLIVAAGPPEQILYVGLDPDVPPFEQALTTGSYPLELTDECGACVVLAGLTGGFPSFYYHASGGVLELTSVSGRLTGSIHPAEGAVEVPLTGLDVDQAPANVPDGCIASVTGAAFDLPIPPPR